MFGRPAREPDLAGFDDASWLLVALGVVLVVAFQLVEPFSFVADGVAKAAAMIGLLWAAARFYTHYRVRPVFAALLTGIMQIILFSIFGAILTYLVASHGGALWDDRLQRWDRALGLDWLAYLRWVNDHPAIGTLYRWAYVTLIPQLLVLTMALATAGRLRTMRIVICAAILSGTAAVLISGLTPAVSNFVHLGLTRADVPNLHPAAAFVHRADFLALRDGSLRSIDLSSLQGIVTFPSYHAALGAIFIWGFLRLGRLGWIGAAWSALMLLATPIDGAHYFVDIFAGVALAAVGLAAAGWLVGKAWLRPIARALGRRSAEPEPSFLPA